MGSKIYTKTGDDGTSSLFNGTRVKKHDLYLQVCGELDALNVALGFAILNCNKFVTAQFLLEIQKDIFTISSIIAGVRDLVINDSRVLEIEKLIDQLSLKLPELQNFILPGGSISALSFHDARVVCRRAERKLAELNEIEKVLPVILRYINRLSDLFFMLARNANFESGNDEVVWGGENS